MRQKGERDYLAEHIPGAVFASLDHDLSDLGRAARPRAASVAARRGILASLGAGAGVLACRWFAMTQAMVRWPLRDCGGCCGWRV
jgi:3-mercaptopyruvate sulfurtransferase SseA